MKHPFPRGLSGAILVTALILPHACLDAVARSRSRVPAWVSRSGIILAPDRIGGIRGWYVLDTGNSKTSVTPEVAARLTPTGRSHLVFSSFGSDSIQAPVVKSGGIHFAGSKVRYPEELDVLDEGNLSKSFRHDVAGTIGWDILRAYVVSIDIRGPRLFAGRTLAAPKVLKRLAAIPVDAKLTLEIMNNGRGDGPYVTARSGAHELRLMLDTGADHTVLFHTTWKRLGGAPLEPGPRARSMTVTGEVTEYRARLHDLRLGALRMTDIPVTVSTVPPRPLRKGASTATSDGVLGMDILARYWIVIDGPGRSLYLAERATNE
ncbi:MAG: TIGR02281 family clan AA aspartic protease [Acidobacteriota bacterium]